VRECEPLDTGLTRVLEAVGVSNETMDDAPVAASAASEPLSVEKGDDGKILIKVRRCWLTVS
jgi:hypothetical protein